jgi:hypothetical protein
MQSLTAGTELTAEQLHQLGKGLIVIAGYVISLPMDPPVLAHLSFESKRARELDREYRLSICKWVTELAGRILKGECQLKESDWMECRLLTEFYWLCHKIPEFLVWTDAEGIAKATKFMGYRAAGLRLGAYGPQWE